MPLEREGFLSRTNGAAASQGWGNDSSWMQQKAIFGKLEEALGIRTMTFTAPGFCSVLPGAEVRLHAAPLGGAG